MKQLTIISILALAFAMVGCSGGGDASVNANHSSSSSGVKPETTPTTPQAPGAQGVNSSTDHNNGAMH